MTEVTRWDLVTHFAVDRMEVKDDGEFVFYSDYQRVEAENSNLSEALRRLSKYIERLKAENKRLREKLLEQSSTNNLRLCKALDLVIDVIAPGMATADREQLIEEALEKTNDRH